MQGKSFGIHVLRTVPAVLDCLRRGRDVVPGALQKNVLSTRDEDGFIVEVRCGDIRAVHVTPELNKNNALHITLPFQALPLPIARLTIFRIPWAQIAPSVTSRPYHQNAGLSLSPPTASRQPCP